MHEVHHFSYGAVTPLIAYLAAVVGSACGLSAVSRSRVDASWKVRSAWLWLGATAIGGTGIWVMHFVAMLGFRIHGASIRYDVPVTIFSAIVAMLVVWVGLALTQQRALGGSALLLGGTIAGAGVGVMHYSGMYAMKTDAIIGYDGSLVVLSLVIAVAASITALWFTLHVRGTLATIGAAAVMGVAVAGMHYTGMFAMHAQPSGHAHVPSGAGAAQLLTPLIVTVSLITVGMLLHLGITEVNEPDPRPIRHSPATEHHWPTRG